LESSTHIAPATLLRGTPHLPSSKYYTLRYVLAAALADGISTVAYPAESDDSEALYRGCRALGAKLDWEDETRRVLHVHGAGRPQRKEPITINVGNAGAVLRLLLGLGALLPDVTFVTDYPQSLGKRPNRELLDALTHLGATCTSNGPDGCLPITIHGSELHRRKVKISGARSSQFLSSLLFLGPLIGKPLEIRVVDTLKSHLMVQMSLDTLQEAGIHVEHDEELRYFYIAPQPYRARDYIVPGDYPSAATWLAACAAMPDAASEIRLERLRPHDAIGDMLILALEAMGADITREGETLIARGGRQPRGIQMDGNLVIDCIPALVAAACFAEGESVFDNIETLHYKESDRIDDLCAELRKAGCAVTPQRDAIIVQGQPGGVEGGVSVDGHADHRLLMALAIVALRSRQGLTIHGTEHVAKSYPHFFDDLHELAHLEA
jgi:3-phosphoshikimate 1-carboxyvinyltransferase